jgi:hypothetical protein
MLELLLVNGRSGKMPRIDIATGSTKVNRRLMLRLSPLPTLHALFPNRLGAVANSAVAGMLEA